jgi:hypothetical protein
MIQGIPNYDWRCITPIKKDLEFTLEHTMSRSEVEKWTSIRVTTNSIGAAVSFYVYSLEITRLEDGEK